MHHPPHHSVLVAFLTVVVTAVFFAIFTWYSVAEFPSHGHIADCGNAQWISPAKKADAGYFVTSIFLDFQITDAWVSIAAEEDATVFVNATEIGSVSFNDAVPSGIFDCTGLLLPGKNIIGIRSQLASYGRTPTVRMRLTCLDAQRQHHTFSTDANWLCETVECSQSEGTITWSSPEFDHSSWSPVKLRNDGTITDIMPSSTPSLVLAEEITASWIWTPDPMIRSATFTKNLTVQRPVRDAYLGISTLGTAECTINGTPVTSDSISPGQTLLIIPITRFLKDGDNVITISTRCIESTPGVLIQAVIEDRSGRTRLESDDSWQTQTSSTFMPITGEHPMTNVDSAVVIGHYPAEPWGIISRKMISLSSLSHTFFLGFQEKLVWFLLHVLAFLSLWLLFAWLSTKASLGSIQERLAADAAGHSPALLTMITLLIIRFDIRNDGIFPFTTKTCLVVIGILVLFRLAEGIRHVAIQSVRSGNADSISPLPRRTAHAVFHGIVLAFLLVAGMIVRLKDSDEHSLSHDEISMLQYTTGLLETGLPVRLMKSSEKVLTTYELVPYSIAVPVLLKDFSASAGRLHSLYWGLLSILLIYFLGRRLFDPMIALVASAIMTFHPWCVIWSQNLFYPQMAMAFALLSAIVMARIVSLPVPRQRDFYLAAICFCATYLTWEGTGFFLGGLTAAYLLWRWEDFSWIRNKHIWIASSAVFIVIILQQIRRIMHQAPYLVMGSKLSNIGLPQLAFLMPDFDATMYIRSFFLIDNNVTVSLFSVLGIVLFWKIRAFRFTISLLLPVFLMTMLLANAANRYSYYMQGFLILLGTATFFTLIRMILIPFQNGDRFQRLLRGTIIGLATLVMFLTTNTLVFKLYLLSESPERPTTLTRTAVAWNNYRDVNHYVSEHFRKGDIIFSIMPHTLEYYTGMTGDYSVTTVMGRTIVYRDLGVGYVGYTDKFIGIPTILSLDQFQQIVNQSGRTWLISIPDISLSRDNDPQTVEFIRKNFICKFESFGGRVFLKE